MIPNYLISKDIEFYTIHNNDYFITCGKTYEFKDAPAYVFNRILKYIAENEDIKTGLQTLKITDPFEKIRKVCRCRFSNFDLISDFEVEAENIEYSPCRIKSSCKAAGLLCKSVKNLSLREIEIARLLTADKSEKEIASAMCLSVNTVHTHLKNIRISIGAMSKAGIVAFLYRNNLA
jgi:DNA-binding CsgD family transcriptional regulator